jgi:hypothetical protein
MEWRCSSTKLALSGFMKFEIFQEKIPNLPGCPCIPNRTIADHAVGTATYNIAIFKERKMNISQHYD